MAPCTAGATTPTASWERERPSTGASQLASFTDRQQHPARSCRRPRRRGSLAAIPLSLFCIHDARRQAGGGPVGLTLLESRWKTGKRRLFGVGFASLAIHSAMIAGVVYATPHAAPRDDQVRMDTRVVLLAPRAQQKAVDPPPVQLADALQGFQTVALSAQIPTDMPPVDLQQRFDPKDYSGSGLEGSRAGSVVSGIAVSGNEVYAEALVDERPALLSAPAPVYPALLKQAGIQGRVILPAVIDTTGRVEPASVRIMKSPHPAFDQPTRDWVLKALFRPARLHGRGVRVSIHLVVDYSITPSSGSYSITTWSGSP